MNMDKVSGLPLDPKETYFDRTTGLYWAEGENVTKDVFQAYMRKHQEEARKLTFGVNPATGRAYTEEQGIGSPKNPSPHALQAQRIAAEIEIKKWRELGMAEEEKLAKDRLAQVMKDIRSFKPKLSPQDDGEF